MADNTQPIEPGAIPDGRQHGAQAPIALSKPGQPLMLVKIYAPFKTYYSGNAHSLSAENITGPFDILPHHHNFITLLTACEIVLRTPDGELNIRISGGMMHVKSDELTVFLDV